MAPAQLGGAHVIWHVRLAAPTLLKPLPHGEPLGGEYNYRQGVGHRRGPEECHLGQPLPVFNQNRNFF